MLVKVRDIVEGPTRRYIFVGWRDTFVAKTGLANSNHSGCQLS